MENINNSLNWFEIPVIDFERARKFYGNIYNFDMPSTVMGENRLGFLPVKPNNIGGAIIQAKGHIPSQDGVLVYLNGGADLNDVLGRVESSGGKILQGKTPIPENHGYFALFLDTEGNRVALHSMK